MVYQSSRLRASQYIEEKVLPQLEKYAYLDYDETVNEIQLKTGVSKYLAETILSNFISLNIVEERHTLTIGSDYKSHVLQNLKQPMQKTETKTERLGVTDTPNSPNLKPKSIKESLIE